MFSFENVSCGPLKNLNFKIERKERVILFGPSGAGKSTLLFLFNRLYSPDSGTIYYEGENIVNQSVSQLRKKAGLVLQEPNLFPGTVIDNLKYGPSLFEEWEGKNGGELLEYVQLPASYLERDVEQLSGGEKQRVSLARTLANKPEVLLLDEPTSALDYRTAEEIEEVLDRLIKENGLSMIMVTHNLKQAERLGNRGLFLMDGTIKEDGRLPDMLNRPASRELAEFLEE
ncbi:ABC transporter ATP-binding protein [Halobacillus massiliensis]|uniref:ABC transporter ATP-binding protein n=1 Tax=Halobacillus massiliensis TaxID=1926286 RepID=UPI0009E33CC8|nr:phosphate ABC transporter ATP-binding protein [Halobacillus massiliensis]